MKMNVIIQVFVLYDDRYQTLEAIWVGDWYISPPLYPDVCRYNFGQKKISLGSFLNSNLITLFLKLLLCKHFIFFELYIFQTIFENKSIST